MEYPIELPNLHIEHRHIPQPCDVRRGVTLGGTIQRRRVASPHDHGLRVLHYPGCSSVAAYRREKTGRVRAEKRQEGEQRESEER
ncbi:hypothetical protein E2C01_046989 [Portunus trituberculatus]|uniref:Uncharacterized protein n=1 Tax=Portunus trituberculatus TaxID=210409 RepID=A0A5B7G997_PORTR|nr:hypothetical protein [Portunus trituberculatus]